MLASQNISMPKRWRTRLIYSVSFATSMRFSTACLARIPRAKNPPPARPKKHRTRNKAQNLFSKNEEPRLPGALSPLLIFARAEISCGGGKSQKTKSEKRNSRSEAQGEGRHLILRVGRNALPWCPPLLCRRN